MTTQTIRDPSTSSCSSTTRNTSLGVQQSRPRDDTLASAT
jgi:hypothetical protein